MCQQMKIELVGRVFSPILAIKDIQTLFPDAFGDFADAGLMHAMRHLHDVDPGEGAEVEIDHVPDLLGEIEEVDGVVIFHDGFSIVLAFLNLVDDGEDG